MRSETARRLQQVQSNRGTLSSRQLIAQNGCQSPDSGNGIQPTRVRLDHRHHQQRSPLVQRHRASASRVSATLGCICTIPWQRQQPHAAFDHAAQHRQLRTQLGNLITQFLYFATHQAFALCNKATGF
jgi:hypothetical protein